MEANILPVITLYQPWATWIIRGWKTIETRTHDRFKSLEGKDILIHAGMKTDGSRLTTHNSFLTKEQILFNPDEVVNGAILGKVHICAFSKLEKINSKQALIDCELTDRWGLWLDVVEKYDQPIYVKGDMGIWYFNTDKKEKVLKPKIHRQQAETLKLF